jgi:hypothetical protein
VWFGLVEVVMCMHVRTLLCNIVSDCVEKVDMADLDTMRLPLALLGPHASDHNLSETITVLLVTD